MIYGVNVLEGVDIGNIILVMGGNSSPIQLNYFIH